VLVVDMGCNIYMLDFKAYQGLKPTMNMNTTCSPRLLTRLEVPEDTTCTGISHGLRSNVSAPCT
jgi:hypothetical protein